MFDVSEFPCERFETAVTREAIDGIKCMQIKKPSRYFDFVHRLREHFLFLYLLKKQKHRMEGPL